jgi:hypothetical protein
MSMAHRALDHPSVNIAFFSVVLVVRHRPRLAVRFQTFASMELSMSWGYAVPGVLCWRFWPRWPTTWTHKPGTRNRAQNSARSSAPVSPLSHHHPPPDTPMPLTLLTMMVRLLPSAFLIAVAIGGFGC